MEDDLAVAIPRKILFVITGLVLLVWGCKNSTHQELQVMGPEICLQTVLWTGADSPSNRPGSMDSLETQGFCKPESLRIHSLAYSERLFSRLRPILIYAESGPYKMPLNPNRAPLIAERQDSLARGITLKAIREPDGWNLEIPGEEQSSRHLLETASQSFLIDGVHLEIGLAAEALKVNTDILILECLSLEDWQHQFAGYLNLECDSASSLIRLTWCGKEIHAGRQFLETLTALLMEEELAGKQSYHRKRVSLLKDQISLLENQMISLQNEIGNKLNRGNRKIDPRFYRELKEAEVEVSRLLEMWATSQIELAGVTSDIRVLEPVKQVNSTK